MLATRDDHGKALTEAEEQLLLKACADSRSLALLPVNDHMHAIVEFLSGRFPEQKPDHFLFASERYGVSGDLAQAHAYATDPSKPIKSLKEAWEHAKLVSGVTCRFHDLRHTAATRMLEGGSPLMVVASILGWSPSTAARMAKRYCHIGNSAQLNAVEMLMIEIEADAPEPRGAQRGAQ